jgi:hypothetical protein
MGTKSKEIYTRKPVRLADEYIERAKRAGQAVR